MKNCDISISRGYTISAGDFNNVKPAVTLTIKDVPIEKSSSAYKIASSVVDSMIALEALKALDEMDTIKKKGTGHYKKILEDNKEKIEAQLELKTGELYG